MDSRYTGKVALVTGAASGVGRATALRLRAEGARVAGLDRAPVDLDGVLPIVADVTSEDSVRSAVAAVVDAYGGLDLVANVAGVASYAHTTDVPLAEWDRILAVNLTGTFLVCRAVLPHLVAGRGALVNVSSLAGVRGWRYSAAYSAAKAGVVGLTRALAVEYAPDGVRVSCVCPGSVDTPLKQGLVPVRDQHPVLAGHGRALVEPPVMQADEVAAAIAYLGSAEARFAVGTILRLDGGAGA